MRYLALLLLHISSVILALAPMGYFAGAMVYGSKLIGLENILISAVTCFVLLPFGVGILTGVLIDSLSVAMRGKKFYDKGDWSKTRRRAILLSIVAMGVVYWQYFAAAS